MTKKHSKFIRNLCYKSIPPFITIVSPLLTMLFLTYKPFFYELFTTIFVVVSIFMIPFQMLMFYFVFYRFKGESYIFKNCIESRDYYLRFVYGSIIILVLLFAIDVRLYGEVLNAANIHTVSGPMDPNLKYALNTAVLWSFLAAVIILVSTLNSTFNYGRAIAYFKASEVLKNSVDKKYFIYKGLQSYEKYLVETTGLKIKNFEKIVSHYTLTDENKFKELIESFDKIDRSKPICEIKQTFNIDESEFFTQLVPFESIEKIAKIIYPAIAIIVGSIGLYLQYFQK